MPQFDLRGIKVAQYNNSNGTVTYTNGTSIGDAMSVDLNLRYAEGRLYAESRLAEYMKKCVGGTISIAEKYIPNTAQKLLFGAEDSTRNSVSSATVTGLKFASKDVYKNVGVAFYAPDMVDGAEKYTCVFIPRALFAPPSLNLRTQGENIQFATPTVSGEFMPSHAATAEYLETAVVDTEAVAKAWVDKVLGISGS